MTVVALEAIQFNHDPNSATGDALNIRRNATQVINVPEWRRGISVNPEDSPAAYAMRETEGRTLTIKVQLRAMSPDIESLEIRAIDPTYEPQPGGCVWSVWISWLLRLLIRLISGNVLGDVKERLVNFPPGGLTDFEAFELQNVALWGVGVGVRTTTWRWQYRTAGSGEWTDFATTDHRIYVVAEAPKSPWVQLPYAVGNTQLVWTDVLDYACRWASLSKTLDEAAGGVTRGVYELGPAIITYDCPGGGSSHYSGASFNRTRFIERLKGTRQRALRQLYGLRDDRIGLCQRPGLRALAITDGGAAGQSRLGFRPQPHVGHWLNGLADVLRLDLLQLP